MWRVLLSSSSWAAPGARVESQPAHLHLAKVWAVVALLARVAGRLRRAGSGRRRRGRQALVRGASRGARRRAVPGQLERKVLVEAQAAEGVLNLIRAEQRQRLLAEAVRLQRRTDHRHRRGRRRAAVRKHLARAIGPTATRRHLRRFVQAERQPQLVHLRLAHQRHDGGVEAGANERAGAAREGCSRWAGTVCGRGRGSAFFATAAMRFRQWAREIVVRCQRRRMLLERLRKVRRRRCLSASIAHTRGSGDHRRVHLRRVVREGLRLVLAPTELR